LPSRVWLFIFSGTSTLLPFISYAVYIIGVILCDRANLSSSNERDAKSSRRRFFNLFDSFGACLGLPAQFGHFSTKRRRRQEASIRTAESLLLFSNCSSSSIIVIMDVKHLKIPTARTIHDGPLEMPFWGWPTATIDWCEESMNSPSYVPLTISEILCLECSRLTSRSI